MKILAPAAALFSCAVFLSVFVVACATNDEEEQHQQSAVAVGSGGQQSAAPLTCKGALCFPDNGSTSGMAPPDNGFWCPIGSQQKSNSCGGYQLYPLPGGTADEYTCGLPKCTDGGGAGGYVQYQAPCPAFHIYACDNTGHCYCR